MAIDHQKLGESLKGAELVKVGEETFLPTEKGLVNVRHVMLITSDDHGMLVEFNQGSHVAEVHDKARTEAKAKASAAATAAADAKAKAVADAKAKAEAATAAAKVAADMAAKAAAAAELEASPA
jgi:hypothetical protein